MLGPKAWDSRNTGTLEGQPSFLHGAPGLPHLGFDVGLVKPLHGGELCMAQISVKACPGLGNGGAATLSFLEQ